jgi:hypothetical protein
MFPPIGSCAGPTAKVLAMRKDISSINQNCPIDQIPISSTMDKNVFVCGECVPGSHGNYDIMGTTFLYTDTGLDVTIVDERKAEAIPSLNTLKYQCPLNYYCTGQGKCEHMSTLPNYNASCVPIAAPFSLAGRKEICGEQGLSCIANRCKICVPGTKVQHHKKLLWLNLQFWYRPPIVYQEAYCINGEYKELEWARMSDFGPYPELVLTFVLGGIAVLYFIQHRVSRLIHLYKKETKTVKTLVTERPHQKGLVLDRNSVHSGSNKKTIEISKSVKTSKHETREEKEAFNQNKEEAPVKNRIEMAKHDVVFTSLDEIDDSKSSSILDRRIKKRETNRRSFTSRPLLTSDDFENYKKSIVCSIQFLTIAVRQISILFVM